MNPTTRRSCDMLSARIQQRNKSPGFEINFCWFVHKWKPTQRMEELHSVKPLKKFKVNWKLESWYSGKPVLSGKMSASEVSPVFYSLLKSNAFVIFIYRYWGSPVDRNIPPNNVNLCVLIFGFSSGSPVAIIFTNHDGREWNWSEVGSPGMSEAWTKQSTWDLHPHSNKKLFGMRSWCHKTMSDAAINCKINILCSRNIQFFELSINCLPALTSTFNFKDSLRSDTHLSLFFKSQIIDFVHPIIFIFQQHLIDSISFYFYCRNFEQFPAWWKLTDQFRTHLVFFSSHAMIFSSSENQSLTFVNMFKKFTSDSLSTDSDAFYVERWSGE